MSVTINGTTGIAGVDGSASTPSYQGADTNTGIAFPAADTVTVATGGTERMRVNSSGNVGIGTSSPNNRLHVLGSTDTRLRVEESGGTFVDSVVTSSGHYIDSTGAVDLTLNKIGSANMKFQTNNTERMRIVSDGRMYFGTTSNIQDGRYTFSGTFSTNRGLVVNTTENGGTAIYFSNQTNGAGYIQINTNNTVSYNTSSDYRLKENVVPMTGALATVAQLNPVTYTWKTDGSAGQGFIAHELQAVVPDCVNGEKDGVDAEGNPVYQGIDTSFLVATLTAAIKEQQATIESLTARIEALEAQP